MHGVRLGEKQLPCPIGVSWRCSVSENTTSGSDARGSTTVGSLKLHGRLIVSKEEQNDNKGKNSRRPVKRSV